MKIAIIGSGGVGGYFGARLAASGQDVTFVARGAHLEAMQKKGLKVWSALGDLHVPEVKATKDTTIIGPVDVVLIAVKLWSTEEAAQSAKRSGWCTARPSRAPKPFQSVTRPPSMAL